MIPKTKQKTKPHFQNVKSNFDRPNHQIVSTYVQHFNTMFHIIIPLLSMKFMSKKQINKQHHNHPNIYF